MQTTLASKILCIGAAAPIVLALAGCSSGGSSPGPSSSTTSSTSHSSGTSATSTTSGSTGMTTTSSGTGTGTGTSSSSGSSGVTDAGPDATATFATVYSDVLSHCVGCHGLLSDGGLGGGILVGKLDMGDAAAAWENLVGADGGGVMAQGILGTTNTPMCATLGTDAGLKRVMPGDPAHSLLCNKLASNAGDGGTLLLSDGGPEVFCGAPMPYHAAALSAPMVNEVKAWIEAGAKP